MTTSKILQEWKHRQCVLATMHGKEKVIRPLVKKELGIEIIVPTGLNTDFFGTFTRDVKRRGSQIEAARAKARKAMQLTKSDLAISSEGSFGMHPSIPFFQSNLELVLLIDTVNNIEVVGHHRSNNVRFLSQKVHSPKEVIECALSWRFPEQGVILRESEKSNRNIYKELTTIDSLKEAAESLLSKAPSVVLETDMRAHRCPARMESIQHATIDLMRNCKSVCPQCTTPGFVIVDTVKGLPCAGCGLETDMPKETVWACRKCTYQEKRLIENKTATDPSECQWCNP